MVFIGSQIQLFDWLQVNINENHFKGRELGDRYEVNSYPMFYYFKQGKMKFKVNLGHSVEKMTEFCRNPVFIELPKSESAFEVPTNVTILQKNAEVWLNIQESALVMAHTEWCGHCKKMKPDYILAADDLYSEKGMLAAVDGDRFKGTGVILALDGLNLFLRAEVLTPSSKHFWNHLA